MSLDNSSGNSLWKDSKVIFILTHWAYHVSEIIQKDIAANKSPWLGRSVSVIKYNAAHIAPDGSSYGSGSLILHVLTEDSSSVAVVILDLADMRHEPPEKVWRSITSVCREILVESDGAFFLWHQTGFHHVIPDLRKTLERYNECDGFCKVMLPFRHQNPPGIDPLKEPYKSFALQMTQLISQCLATALEGNPVRSPRQRAAISLEQFFDMIAALSEKYPGVSLCNDFGIDGESGFHLSLSGGP